MMHTADPKLLTKVLDLLPDTVCVVDREGHFVYVSPGCERLLGYMQGELIDRNMIEFVFPEDRERTLEAASDIMKGHPRMNFENRYVGKNGRIVNIMWSARWSETDHLRIAVARDVTELKNSARLQEAVYRISEAAHVAEDMFSLCQHIHRIIAGLVPADNFAVALYDTQSDTFSFPYFVDRLEQWHEPHVLRSSTPIIDVLHTGDPLLRHVADTKANLETNAAENGECLNWLGVPLFSRRGIAGVLAMQTGADGAGYTCHDRDLSQFISTHIADTLSRKQTEIRLRQMASHDALTNLPNRILFHDRFDTALKRARRNEERLALLYLDLDGFKQINDTCGHEAGDQILSEVAQRLARCMRETDTIGRRSEDEFTVLLTDIRESSGIDIIVEKIRATINVPFKLGGRTLTVSASIGVAVYPEDGDETDQLLRHADASMYAAKHRGNRNRPM